MREWRNGASRLAMGVVVAALFAPMAAEATSFSVTTGTDTVAKTITGTETGSVSSGATLNTTATAISWAGPSAAAGVTITNAGTIMSRNRGIDTSGNNPPRSLTLNNLAGALISTVDDAFRLNTAIGAGTVTINNAGTIV